MQKGNLRAAERCKEKKKTLLVRLQGYKEAAEAEEPVA